MWPSSRLSGNPNHDAKYETCRAENVSVSLTRCIPSLHPSYVGLDQIDPFADGLLTQTFRESLEVKAINQKGCASTEVRWEHR